MTRRLNGGDQDGQDLVKGQLKQLFDDDAFLTDLSRGVDPSEGTDIFAGLLLDLTKEAQEPPAAMPDWSTLLPGILDQDSPVEATSDTTVMQDISPATQEFAPVSLSATPEHNADTSATVVPLAARREKRARKNARGTHVVAGTTANRKSHPFLNGLVGAAAATLVIAGGGTAVYNADETSLLYGMNQQLFGNQDSPSVVELASTLEEVDSRTASGDVEGARALLEQARAMLDGMENSRKAPAETVIPTESAPRTETLTATVTESSMPEPPATETQTVTSTEVHTVTTTAVAPPVWTPNPEPIPSITPPTGVDPEGPSQGEDSGLVPPQTPGN